MYVTFRKKKSLHNMDIEISYKKIYWTHYTNTNYSKSNLSIKETKPDYSHFNTESS